MSSLYFTGEREKVEIKWKVCFFLSIVFSNNCSKSSRSLLLLFWKTFILLDFIYSYENWVKTWKVLSIFEEFLGLKMSVALGYLTLKRKVTI